MTRLLQPFTTLIFLLLLCTMLLMTGCSGSSTSGSVGYGVYRDYGYSDRYYDDDDLNVRVDRDNVEQRRYQRPERQANYQAARSRGPSMGRPSGAGRGGGRR
jgi:major membrane immunogen (membrane-anchored lipoprotein)